MLMLVVEDDVSVSRFLTRGLREEGHTVDVCAEGLIAQEQALKMPYDLVILDWSLPDSDGLSLLRSWRAQGMTAPVLMLTARGGVEATVLALDAGADDYLSKPFSFEELLARVRALGRRAQRSGEAQLGLVPLGEFTLNLKRRTLEPKEGEEVSLSSREFALLDAFLQRRGEVLSRSKLLELVWGLSHDPSTNVVDVYVRYLRQKLDVEGEPSLIETVRGRGYRLKKEGEVSEGRGAEGSDEPHAEGEA